MDILVAIGCNHNFYTTVYRKPTHTDQYLHWDSSHFIIAKQSVYNTLADRAKIVSSNQEALHKALDHIKKPLQVCQFPSWALNQLQHKFIRKHNNNQDSNPNINSSNTDNNNNTNITIVVPYIQGLEKKCKWYANQKVYRYILRAPTP